MNTKIERVAIYARVSTDKRQNDPRRQETENQLVQLREFCDHQGWSITGEYIDRASGSKSDRPAFKQLFEDAHQHKFDLVFFWALDRFSREGVLETLTYLQRLDQCGVAYRSFTEQYIDSAGMFRDAIISILATLAKQERVRMSERTIAGLERARAKGKQLGRPPLSPEIIEDIRKLRALDPPISFRKIAAKHKISVGSAAKALKAK